MLTSSLVSETPGNLFFSFGHVLMSYQSIDISSQPRQVMVSWVDFLSNIKPLLILTGKLMATGINSEGHYALA